MKQDDKSEPPPEESLHESQARLSGIIDSAMDAIITVDEEQRVLVFNRAAEKMFHCPAREAIGQSLDRFIPKRFRPSHSSHIQSFGHTGVSTRAMAGARSVYGLRAGGEEFPLEASISQVEAGGQKLYTVIMRDITERKEAEMAASRLAAIVESSSDAIVGKDLHSKVTSWNAGAERMFGYAVSEMIGQSITRLIPADRHDDEAKILARIRRGESVEHFETQRIRKDGEVIDISVSVSPIRDAEGQVVGASKVARDITERKQVENEVRRLNEDLELRVAQRTAELRAVNKELEAFSYSVSHDLRAPLRHINGFSQALLEDYADKLDEVGKGYLQEVRGASQEMARLIDDVLQLARVTRSEMRREKVNLTELARSIASALQAQDAERTVAVDIEEALSTGGDKRLLGIMLGNLMGNAWKFTSKTEGAKISFGHTRRDDEFVYFVRDNGAGFDMAYVGKLFGAFQRLHTAGEFEGTGIGLATVQRVVHRHGGRVWAEGALNQGATFYFTLADFKETGNGQQSDLAG